MSDFDADLAAARLRNRIRQAVGRRTNYDTIIDLLRTGPKTARELIDATPFSDELVGAVLCVLRKRGRIVKLVRTRRDEIKSRYGARRSVEIALYAVASTSEAWLPYEPRARREKLAEVVIEAPSARAQSAKKRSGSGVIAPPPYYRGAVWGAGW